MVEMKIKVYSGTGELIFGHRHRQPLLVLATQWAAIYIHTYNCVCNKA